jgi:hypothetical protein
MFYQRPGSFGGMDVQIVDAQMQRRTPRDVRGPWLRPKLPSRITGRKGTRRGWKRANPPHYVMMYREPDDVLVIYGQIIVATPRQADALRRQNQFRNGV